MTYNPIVPEYRSAFGDNLTSKLKPQVSLKATYGVLDECQIFTATGGSVTSPSGEFVCQTGVSVGGYGVVWSRRPVVYKSGVAAEARVTARFTAGVASSLQTCGFFTALDGMFFGFNGTSFGVMHRHGGSFEIRTLTVTAASGSSQTATITLNGTAYTAPVTSGTVQSNAHEIEVGLNAGAAANLWYIQHIDDTVILVSKNAAAAAGAYSVSVDGGTLTGSIAQDQAGMAPTEDWTAQGAWNIDTASWLTTSNGNIYRFEFAYLGYGPLVYSIYHPSLRRFIPVHFVEWTNANTGVNFGNPSMRVGWVSASLGSSTNLTVAGASAMGGLQGEFEDFRTFGATGIESGVTTERQVISLQCRREFNGKSNNSVVLPQNLTMSTDSSKGAVFRVLLNTTVAGTTDHQYVDESESVCLVDSNGTTVSGGRVLGEYSVGPSGSITIDMKKLELFLVTGDELTITARVTSGAASDMDVSLTWGEYV